jgi:hypothetical protein
LDSSDSRQSTNSLSSETVKNSFKYRIISQKLCLKLRHKKFKTFCFATNERIQSFENYQIFFFVLKTLWSVTRKLNLFLFKILLKLFSEFTFWN